MPADISKRDAGSVHTFSTIAVPGVHYVLASCHEIDCDKMATGWKANVDESIYLGQVWAHFIRHVTALRGWTEFQLDNGITRFSFPPGTPCFQNGLARQAHRTLGVTPHRRRIAPQLHVVSTGDAWRVGREIGNAAETGRPPRLQDQRTVADGAAWARELAERWNQQTEVINNR